MSTASKKAWRVQHPEQSREAERERAQARRDGFWGTKLKPCASSDSYWKYEPGWDRMMQRMWWPTLGAGAHRLTVKQRGKAINARFSAKRAELVASDPYVTDLLRWTAQHTRWTLHNRERSARGYFARYAAEHRRHRSDNERVRRARERARLDAFFSEGEAR